MTKDGLVGGIFTTNSHTDKPYFYMPFSYICSLVTFHIKTHGFETDPQCLRCHGVPFVKRGARQMTVEDYRHYDRIYVMDGNNLRWLRYILPGEITASPDYRDKVSLLMSLCDEERDVADPWYTGDFERTYRDIDRALQTALKMTSHE